MAMMNEDLNALQEAKHILENPGFAARITNLLGKPIEWSLDKLPDKWSHEINRATKKAITVALEAAIYTLDKRYSGGASNMMHKVLVTATGAAGGAFGLAALPVELPISTTVMLRSIADVARSHGEDIRAPEAKLACIEVFALGGKSKGDDASETGYFALRATLAKSVSEAVAYIAEKGLADEGAPVLVRLIAKIAARFQIAVSEKAAAQTIPILGAIGGGTINFVFMDHFQDMAHGHFTIRKLERKYGAEAVKAEYDRLPD